MWFELKGDERITQRCATEGCAGQPIYRLEAEGVGSNYCSGCRARIESLRRSLDQLQQKYQMGVEKRIKAAGYGE